MSQRTVTHQIKLPLSLTITLGLIAFGLIANVLKPVLKIEEAFAAGQVHKITICTEDGFNCLKAARANTGGFYIRNF